MPPYAGLDEIFHVARLSFTASEHRQPGDGELSVPGYLASSVYESPKGIAPNRPAVLPAFALAGSEWPGMVARGLTARGDERLSAQETRTYFEPNYEAQQPSLYYVTHAWLVPGSRTAADELVAWRRASLVMGLATVIAIAVAAARYWGSAGLVGAALITSLPTWETLVNRVGNDALACAAIACGVAATLAAPKRLPGWIGESIVWGIAAATKLYSWPLAPAMLLIWYRQRAPLRRCVVVVTVVLGAVLATMLDLRSRTSNPLGLFAFDPVVEGTRATGAHIAVGEILKIIVATGIWTSGQHGNALTLLGSFAYAAPLLLAAAATVPAIRKELRNRDELRHVLPVALLTFAVAQLINLAGYLRSALVAGSSLPAGGKEGWYWYCLAPILTVTVVGPLLLALQKRHHLALVALVAWVVSWDVLITDVALLSDYAGVSDPFRRSLLFRWAPDGWRFATQAITRVSVDPLASFTLELRVLHIFAMAALITVVLRGSRTSNVLQ